MQYRMPSFGSKTRYSTQGNIQDLDTFTTSTIIYQPQCGGYIPAPDILFEWIINSGRLQNSTTIQLKSK